MHVLWQKKNLELAKDIVKTFIEEDFEGGRHQKRIDMLKEK